MKVCLLAPTPPPIGGIAGWTVRMLEAELENDWSVVVVDEKLSGKRTGFGGRKKPVITDEVIRCCRIWWNLWKCLIDKDVRIVHACIPATSTAIARECISAVISKVRKRRFIVHFRCTVPNMIKTKVGYYLLKLLCWLSDCVILLNQQSEEYVSGITKTRLEVIPNFIDQTEIEASHEIREQIQRVVYVGGVIASKGAIDLIRVAEQYPGIEFRLVGKADSQCEMDARRVSNVRLVGLLSREDVRKELRDADVFAFLSYFHGEGFSNALAEAMACGLPCLVSDWAANKDMIEDQGGCVVPAKDPQKAANALQQMFSPLIRKRQSEFNISKAREQYSASVVLRKYVECYERCLRDE